MYGTFFLLDCTLSMIAPPPLHSPLHRPHILAHAMDYSRVRYTIIADKRAKRYHTDSKMKATHHGVLMLHVDGVTTRLHTPCKVCVTCTHTSLRVQMQGSTTWQYNSNRMVYSRLYNTGRYNKQKKRQYTRLYNENPNKHAVAQSNNSWVTYSLMSKDIAT